MTINGSRSEFPERIDSFVELFDLPSNLIQSAQRLVELKSQSQLSDSEQQELSQLNTKLRTFQLTPEDWNKLADSIYNTQEFFTENVKDYIANKQNEWRTYVNDFKFIGKWQAGQQYKTQNMVTNEKGDLYICKVSHLSSESNKPNLDGSTANWGKLSAKGDKGIPGLKGDLKGEWSSQTAYKPGDTVTIRDNGIDGGLVYIALEASTGVSPESSQTKWMLYNQLLVGDEPPRNTVAGLHFIQVLN